MEEENKDFDNEFQVFGIFSLQASSDQLKECIVKNDYKSEEFQWAISKLKWVISCVEKKGNGE